MSRFALIFGLAAWACSAEPSSTRLLETPDANTSDANTPDANTPDANTPGADARRPDANTPDAKTPDANTPDANTPGPDAAPPPAASLFDETAAPALLQIDLRPEDWARLQATARDEIWVPCAVTLGAERFENASVRYKGSYGSLIACFDEAGRRLCPKLSLKVSFNETDPDGRFQGLRKFVLNSCNRDPSCLRERLSYAAFRAAGLPASRAVHMRVRLNGEPEGVYLLVENPDHEYLEDHFADASGNLYKEAWPASTRAEAYRGALITNESAGDVEHLVEFARVLDQATDATFNDRVDPYIDRDAMMRYFVVDQFVNNWDGIWKWYCQGPRCGNHNFFLYDDPGSGRFVVLPWDLDYSLTQPNADLGRSWFEEVDCAPGETAGTPGVRAPQCDPLLRGLMRQNRELYREHLRRLVLAEGAPLSEAALLSRIDRWRAMIGGAMAADPLGPGAEAWARAVANLRQIVRAQVREVARRVDERE